MVICLERDADLRMAQLMLLPLTVSCFSKIQIGFLVPAHPGSPGKKGPLNGCVCVCFLLWLRYDTIRQAILTCTQKKADIGQLNLPHENQLTHTHTNV